MKKIKIIGCGNLLAYDEGVGIHVVRRLQNEILPGNVEVKELRNPGQLLVELVAGAEKLIIVDACAGKPGEKAGKVHRLVKNGGELKEILSHTVHAYNFYPVFELRERITPNKLPEEIVVICIGVVEREKFCVGLSNEVFASLGKAIDAIMKELY